MVSTQKLSRDYLAIGSWIFYALILARSLIEPYWEFATPLLIAAIPIIAAEILTDKTETYTTKALILAYFSTQFYQDTAFSIFAWILVAGVPISAYYAKNTPKKILYGILLAVLSIGIAYLLTPLFLS